MLLSTVLPDSVRTKYVSIKILHRGHQKVKLIVVIRIKKFSHIEDTRDLLRTRPGDRTEAPFLGWQYGFMGLLPGV
jgi:hypothetical protein